MRVLTLQIGCRCFLALAGVSREQSQERLHDLQSEDDIGLWPYLYFIGLGGMTSLLLQDANLFGYTIQSKDSIMDRQLSASTTGDGLAGPAPRGDSCLNPNP